MRLLCSFLLLVRLRYSVPLCFCGFGFSALLHAQQLVLPEPLEGLRPLMQRTDRFGVGAIKDLPAVAPCTHQSYVAQYTKVLGDGRLAHSQRHHNVIHRALPLGKIAQYLAATWFSYRVESVRSGCR